MVACGRRWGKTTLGIHLARAAVDQGFPVAWGAPHYKYLGEPFRTLNRELKPHAARSSRTERRIELRSGGSIDFWTLSDSDAGRGHKYKLWIIDEAAMIPHLEQVFQEAIMPTLVDLRGSAWMLSTPKGRGFYYECFRKGQDEEESDWRSWQMPSATNPYLPAEEIERARLSLPHRVFAQEMLAEFGRDDDTVFENVEECGGSVPRDEPDRSRTYLAGVDLARHQDFTVVAILDDQGNQVFMDRFRRLSWSRQVARVADACRRFQAVATVDATGVGDPLIEQIRAAGVDVRPFSFTGPSKQALIDHLALALEQKQIRLLDDKTQMNELLSYRSYRLPGGGIGTSAPSGGHDDCVIALALAAWRLYTPAVEMFSAPYFNF